MKKSQFLILITFLGVIIIGLNIYQEAENEKVNIKKEKAQKAAIRRCNDQLKTMAAIKKVYPQLTNEDVRFLIKLNNSLSSIDKLFPSSMGMYPIVIKSTKENETLLWADGKQEKHFKGFTPYESIFFFTVKGEKNELSLPTSRYL